MLMKTLQLPKCAVAFKRNNACRALSPEPGTARTLHNAVFLLFPQPFPAKDRSQSIEMPSRLPDLPPTRWLLSTVMAAAPLQTQSVHGEDEISPFLALFSSFATLYTSYCYREVDPCKTCKKHSV